MTTSADNRVASHGRGGAGNIAKDDPTNYPKPEDLVTPKIKSNTYTTGRGGTGNMAHNDPEHPEVARAAQDVELPPQHEPQGPKHYGRGGAANIIDQDGQPRKSGEAKRKSEEVKREEGHNKGLFAKGKEILNKLGKK
ncbi:Nn.00g098500.m01.CDS01 [Neocucurbitaria sp. VM-36]